MRRDVHSILYKGNPLEEPFKPTHDPSNKKKRYWPGRAPDYVKEDEEEVPSSESETEEPAPVPAALEKILNEDVETRLMHHRVEVDDNEEGDIILMDKLTRGAPKLDIKGDDVKLEEMDLAAEEVARTRELKASAIEKRRKEEQAVLEQQRLAIEEASESEYTTDSDEEDVARPRVLHKPVFVPKDKRCTIAERDAQELMDDQDVKIAKEERIRESKELVIKTLTAEANMEEVEADPLEYVPEERIVDDAEEREKWKLRELTRMQREKTDNMKWDKLYEEVEARRAMTEEERRKDDERLDALHPKREKGAKYVFMQKYYHRGAFYLDDDAEVLKRDYNLPVAGDLVEKDLLPDQMRLRRGLYGKVGQVKHTHLSAEDTSDLSSGWAHAQRAKEAQKSVEQERGRKRDRPREPPRDREGDGRRDSRGH